MSKSEFIRGLQQALYGNVSEAQISDCVHYYETYFQTEISRGRSEREICEELGDPHLIARSIIDVNGGRNDNTYTYYDSDDYTESNDGSYSGQSQRSGGQSGAYQYSYDPEARYDRSYDQRNVYEDMQHPIHVLSGWKAILFGVMILMAILAVIFVVTSITISLLPLILPVIVVILILRLFFY